jgi:hypothetical protein
MSLAPNVRDLLEGHIGLELESIDRLYRNGYVPQLQHGPGLVGFLCQQRGQPIASPALPRQITGRFVAEVKAFAKEQGIPLFHFERNESKDRRAHQLRRERPVRGWGECFIKVCSYAPRGLKLYLNGHEWLKRQLMKEGIGFESLDKRFFELSEPGPITSSG